MAWLKDHKEREINGLKKAISSLSAKTDEKSTDWLSDQIVEMKNNSMKVKLQNYLNKLEKNNEKFETVKKRIQVSFLILFLVILSHSSRKCQMLSEVYCHFPFIILLCKK